MKKIEQIRENYDFITEKEEADTRKLVILARAGLFESTKLPMYKRALSKDAASMTIAERKAIVELSEALMSEIISSQDINLMEGISDRNNMVSDIPSVIVLKRKAIRQYPGHQQVGLYYSQHLDRYVSIPFGPENKIGNPGINEDVDWYKAYDKYRKSNEDDTDINPPLKPEHLRDPAKVQSYMLRVARRGKIDPRYLSGGKEGSDQAKVRDATKKYLNSRGLDPLASASIMLGQRIRGRILNFKDKVTGKSSAVSPSVQPSAPTKAQPWGKTPTGTSGIPLVKKKPSAPTTPLPYSNVNPRITIPPYGAATPKAGITTTPTRMNTPRKNKLGVGDQPSGDFKFPKVSKKTSSDNIQQAPSGPPAGVGDQPVVSPTAALKQKLLKKRNLLELFNAEKAKELEAKAAEANVKPKAKVPTPKATAPKLPGIIGLAISAATSVANGLRNVDRRDSPKINRKIERDNIQDLEDQQQGERLRQNIKPSKQWGVDTTNPTSYVDTPPKAPVEIPAPITTPVTPKAPAVIPAPITTPATPSAPKAPKAPVEIPAPSKTPATPSKKDKEELEKPELKPQLAPPVILAPSTGVSPQTATQTSRTPPSNSNTKLDGKNNEPNRKRTSGNLDFDLPALDGNGKELAPGNFTMVANVVGPRGRSEPAFKQRQRLADRMILGIPEQFNHRNIGKVRGKPLPPSNFNLQAKLVNPKGNQNSAVKKRQNQFDREILMNLSETPRAPNAGTTSTPRGPNAGSTPNQNNSNNNDNYDDTERWSFDPSKFTKSTRQPPARSRMSNNLSSPFDDIQTPKTGTEARIEKASRDYSRNFAKRAMDDRYKHIQKESVITTLKSMVEENVSEMQLNISESSIKINTTIAKKVVDVYESLNKDNKKKMEDMLGESVDSFKKILSFSVRQ